MNTLLFLDDWALDSRTNVERRMGRPRLIKEFPHPAGEEYGEGNFVAAFYIPDKRRYRLFNTFAPPSLEEWKKTGGGLAVLESQDGVEWHHPSVTPGDELWRAPSGRPRMRDGGVLFDPDEPDEQRRYKLTARISYTGESRDMKGLIAFSPDGLKWDIDDSSVWHLGNPDTANWLLRRKRAGKWAATTRPIFGDRRIALVESDDLKTWSSPRVILTPDALDPPTAQLYGMPAFPYEDLFIGFLWLMTTDPHEMNVSKMWGRCDARLAYSYDGLAWQRVTHEPFVACDDFTDFGNGSIYPSTFVVTPDDRILIYSRASIVEHLRASEIPPDVKPHEMLQVHELRRDGFAYLQSAGGYGEVVTKPLRLDGPELSLNVLSPVGEVRVEIADVNGKPLEGYSLEDCTPFRGDALFWEPRWHDRADLAQAVTRGESVRLRIRLFHARLYAIRVPCHVCYFPGYFSEYFG